MTETLTPVATAGHRIGLDAVNWRAVLAAVKAGQLFRGMPASIAMGYLDGRFAWPSEAWRELGAAGIGARQQVGITVFGKGGEAMRAREGDSEPGDMTPAQVAAWVKAEHDAGHWPVPYCDRADKPHVIAECAKLGLRISHDYGLIVATLDGTTRDLDGSDLTAQPGVVGVQIEQAFSPVHVAGQPADLDVVLVCSTAWRAPKLPPPPPPVQDGFLVLAGQAGGLTGRAVSSADGGKTWR